MTKLSIPRVPVARQVAQDEPEAREPEYYLQAQGFGELHKFQIEDVLEILKSLFNFKAVIVDSDNLPAAFSHIRS